MARLPECQARSISRYNYSQHVSKAVPRKKWYVYRTQVKDDVSRAPRIYNLYARVQCSLQSNQSAEILQEKLHCGRRMAASTSRGPHRPVGPVTDLTKWRLTSHRGRQTWQYEEEEEEEEEESVRRGPSFIEMHALGLDTVSSPAPPPISRLHC